MSLNLKRSLYCQFQGTLSNNSLVLVFDINFPKRNQTSRNSSSLHCSHLLSMCGIGVVDGGASSLSLYVIIGHFKLANSKVGDDGFDAHSVHGAEFESLRLRFDVLRLRPNLRNENERIPNVVLSHSVLKQQLPVLKRFTLFASFVLVMIALFDLCFRLFFELLELCS